MTIRVPADPADRRGTDDHEQTDDESDRYEQATDDRSTTPRTVHGQTISLVPLAIHAEAMLASTLDRIQSLPDAA